MATKRPAISFKELSPRIVGALTEYRPARVQRFEIRGNFPTTDIQEHGNNQLAGIVYEIPDYTVTMEALDVSIKLFAALTGTDATSYPAEGVSINALDTVDIIADVKSQTVMDYVKSLYIRKCRATGLRFTYTVDGQSREEYTFSASTRYLFTHDVIVDVLSAASSPATLTETPEQLRSGDYCVSVMVDGVYQTEVTGVPGAGEYSVSGTSLSFGTTGTTLTATYKANPAGTNWAYVSDSSIPAAISGKDVPVYIYAEDPEATITLERVQGINVNLNLRADPIREQGNTEIVDYVTQIPEVTGDISVLDTDEELIELFSTGEIDTAYTEFRTCDVLAGRSLNIRVRMRDPSDPCTTSGAVLKTVYIPSVQLTGEAFASNVGDNLTLTLNWRSATGNLLVFSGEY